MRWILGFLLAAYALIFPFSASSEQVEGLFLVVASCHYNTGSSAACENQGLSNIVNSCESQLSKALGNGRAAVCTSPYVHDSYTYVALASCPAGYLVSYTISGSSGSTSCSQCDYWDPVTQTCKKPQCEAGNEIDVRNPWGSPAPNPICVDSCEYVVQPPSEGIRMCLGVNGGVVQCWDGYVSTGQECTSGSGDPNAPPDREPESPESPWPPADAPKDDEGCYYGPDGMRICPNPSGADCPNKVTMGGDEYCVVTPGDGGDGGTGECPPGRVRDPVTGLCKLAGDGGGEGGDTGGGDTGGGNNGGTNPGGNTGGGGGDDREGNSDMPGYREPGEDCKTASACLNKQWDRVKSTPIVGAIGGLGNIIPSGGSCNPISIDLSMAGMGVPSTTLHCDVAENIRTPIGLIMLVFYVIGGIRIIAEA